MFAEEKSCANPTLHKNATKTKMNDVLFMIRSIVVFVFGVSFFATSGSLLGQVAENLFLLVRSYGSYATLISFPVFHGPLTLGLFARERSKILAFGDRSSPARAYFKLCVYVSVHAYCLVRTDSKTHCVSFGKIDIIMPPGDF
jgi:hypothetical protein